MLNGKRNQVPSKLGKWQIGRIPEACSNFIVIFRYEGMFVLNELTWSRMCNVAVEEREKVSNMQLYIVIVNKTEKSP